MRQSESARSLTRRQFATLVGGGMLLIGSDILLFPLVTPQTTALLGMRTARWLGRVLGAVTMAAGVWIGWF